MELGWLRTFLAVVDRGGFAALFRPIVQPMTKRWPSVDPVRMIR